MQQTGERGGGDLEVRAAGADRIEPVRSQSCDEVTAEEPSMPGDERYHRRTATATP